MRKLLFLGLFFIIGACSSLPIKEVELAKSELEKAKLNEAPTLAQKDYADAEMSYAEAEKFLKAKEGDKAKQQSDKSLEKSRTSILTSKEKKTRDEIETVDKMLAEIKKIYGIEGQFDETKDLGDEAKKKLELVKKIRPAENLLGESKKLYNDARLLIPIIQKNILKSEPIKEVDQFIDLMNKSYDKAKEAEKLLQAELDRINKIREMNNMTSKGDEIATSLEKDPFIATFYAEEKDKVVADYNVLKKAIAENNLEEAEKNKDAFKRLTDFFDKVAAEKLALNNSYRELTDKMIAKIKNFYKQDAESYLEKAKRLREEVYKVYGKTTPARTKTIQNKVEMIEIKTIHIQQQAEEKIEEIKQDESEKTEVKADEKEKVQPYKDADQTSKPEQMLFDKMENFYNDAENLYEKEEFGDSIEKAKESIEMAQKMLALKKQLEGKKTGSTSQKDQTDSGFQNQDIYGNIKVEFKKYTVKSGDCLWKIAMKKSVYRKAHLWPFIWFANKKIIKDPDSIEPNTVLQIPIFK